MVKFSMDIFANLATFDEEINQKNVEGMMKQGAIENILK